MLLLLLLKHVQNKSSVYLRPMQKQQQQKQKPQTKNSWRKTKTKKTVKILPHICDFLSILAIKTHTCYIYASKTQKNKLKINCRPWCTTLCSGNQAMLVLSPHWLAKQNRVFLNKNTPHITEPSKLTALWACTQQWKSFFLLCCLHFLWHTMGRVLLWHAKGRVLLWNEGLSPLVKRRVKSSCETKGQVLLWNEGSSLLVTHEGLRVFLRNTMGWVLLRHRKGWVLQHIKAQVLSWRTKGWVWHMKGWVLFWHMKGRVLFQHTKCHVLFRHIKHRVLLWRTKGWVPLCTSEESNFVAH